MTQGEAEDAADVLRAKGIRMDVYRCPECSGLHIGRPATLA